jgi:hypothetical protein
MVWLVMEGTVGRWDYDVGTVSHITRKVPGTTGCSVQLQQRRAS